MKCDYNFNCITYKLFSADSNDQKDFEMCYITLDLNMVVFFTVKIFVRHQCTSLSKHIQVILSRQDGCQHPSVSHYQVVWAAAIWNGIWTLGVSLLIMNWFGIWCRIFQMPCVMNLHSGSIARLLMTTFFVFSIFLLANSHIKKVLKWGISRSSDNKITF